MALKRATALTLAEALAVLLQTWNKAYYQYRKLDLHHLGAIERLLGRHQAALARHRRATLQAMTEREETTVSRLVIEFERVLGPVGAAKALHLLAPRVFPIWDRTIAKAYDLSLGKAGSNGRRYWDFMFITRDQCAQLKLDGNALKAIDEYNDCTHTKGWVR